MPIHRTTKFSFVEIVVFETVTKMHFCGTNSYSFAKRIKQSIVENLLNRIEWKHQLNETTCGVERVFLFHVNVGTEKRVVKNHKKYFFWVNLLD